jgi:hypothetical protein
MKPLSKVNLRPVDGGQFTLANTPEVMIIDTELDELYRCLKCRCSRTDAGGFCHALSAVLHAAPEQSNATLSLTQSQIAGLTLEEQPNN